MNNEDIIISLKNGKVKGIPNVSAFSNKKFYSFLGIPYGKPPLGDLRFKPPIPADDWEGILDATKETKPCVQITSAVTKEMRGSEDCLYLNVHIPELPNSSSSRKPIIVNILTTTGFYFGSSEEKHYGSPDFIMHHDVIYVTFNFRLHIFGFLNLGLPECPGNVGLKDIVLVLKWVKENVHYFGGDSDNITVHGASTGGSVVHLLMMSPLCEDLFHKAIIQGGYAFNPCWSYQKEPIEIARRICHKLKFKEKDPEMMLNFLLEIPALTLTQACMDIRYEDIKSNPGFSSMAPIRPSIEYTQEGAFFPKSPHELIHSVRKIPIIAGICEKEGLYMCIHNPIQILNNNFREVIRKNLWMFDIKDATLVNISRKIKRFYFGDNEVTNQNSDLLKIADLYTDLWFNEYYKSFIDVLTSEPDSKPVYLYNFRYKGKNSLTKEILKKYANVDVTKASHFDDAVYWLNYSITNLSDSDREIVSTLGKLWTNFAKTGNPNSDGEFEIDWKPTTRENPSYLIIDKKLQIHKSLMNQKRVHFWESILDKIEAIY